MLAEAEGRGGQGAGEEGDVDVGMVEGEIVADENEVEGGRRSSRVTSLGTSTGAASVDSTEIGRGTK